VNVVQVQADQWFQPILTSVMKFSVLHIHKLFVKNPKVVPAEV
jgi:hypothetical protein